MASDYQEIADEYLRRYGTDTDDTVGLIGDLYSQRTHFIYELLQNAEDVEAMSVRFTLYADRLEFRHDGHIFNEDHVRGVCGVRRGTKAADHTKIGKFGIGFKSVFNYTVAPEIHSGDEHFRIERYVLPHAVPPQPLASDETLFIFPFQHSEQNASREVASAAQAFAEIGSCLTGLGPRTLLFLEHVEEIHWTVDDVASGSYLREARPAGEGRRVAVLSESGGQTRTEDWLVFERGVVYNDEELVAVQVAYRLDGSEAKGDERIVSAGNCPLVVFFPTAKDTHLHFLLQGPYNTTPARDNVREDALNRFLIEEAASLVAWTLPVMRDMGLLSVSLLEALPIREPDFPPGDLFRPIYEAVLEAFGRDELLPAHGGSYVRSQQAQLADGPLRLLVTEDQLRSLSGVVTPLRWINDQITLNRTPDLYRYVRYTLQISEMAPIDFVRLLSLDFLKRQTDGWIVELYAFLERQQLFGPLLTLVKQRPIIRLEDGTQVAPFDHAGIPNVYLPSSHETNFPTIKREIVADKNARAFLLKLEIKEPDIVAEVVEHVLPRYGPPTTQWPDDDQHERDLVMILQAWTMRNSPRYSMLTASVRNKWILHAYTGDLETSFHATPAATYFPSSDLEVYFDGEREHGLFLYSDLYEVHRDELIELGVNTTIQIEHDEPNTPGFVPIRSDWGYHERGRDGFHSQCQVEGLEFAVTHPTVERAQITWNRILVGRSHLIRGFVESSSNANFRGATVREQDSGMGALVRSRAWLPDRSGGFHIPADLTLDDLPDGFQRDESLARKLGMKSSILSKFVEETGADWRGLKALLDKPEQVLALLHQAGLLETGGDGSESSGSPTEATPIDYAAALEAAFSRDGLAPEFDDAVPGGTVPNPALRRERTETEVRTRMAEEPEREARYRTARMRIWEDRNQEVRTFLYEQYGGKCQICQSAPFARRDGEPYYTGVYLVSRTKGRWIDRPGNALCLCPNCCAKFVFGAVEADDFVEKIASFKVLREGGDRTLAVPVTLCGRTATIRYSERHIIDLQALLSVSTEKPAAAIRSLLAEGG